MRDRLDRRHGPRAVIPNLTLTLSMSLFLALLAFFIVLNAFSNTSPERAAGVYNAVVAAFGFSGTGRAAGATGDEGPGSAADAQEQAAAGLRSVLPDVGFSSRRTADNGRVMAVQIPRAEMEERWPALRSRLADLLVAKNSGGRMLQLLALDGMDAGLVRMARDLAADGVKPGLLAVGYEDRGQAAIELRFILQGAP